MCFGDFVTSPSSESFPLSHQVEVAKDDGRHLVCQTGPVLVGIIHHSAQHLHLASGSSLPPACYLSSLLSKIQSTAIHIKIILLL